MILVVDDHAVTREPLAKLLRYEGFEAVCAANGVEALDALARATPALVLLDVMMPKMNGVELLRHMRADERTRAVPVIALTGTMDPNHLGSVKALGVTEVITKSRFTVEQLLERVRAHVPPPAAHAQVCATRVSAAPNLPTG
jgi:chemosensory pili system protein ChpA (sensor histidine kinase/response regulator)